MKYLFLNGMRCVTNPKLLRQEILHIVVYYKVNITKPVLWHKFVCAGIFHPCEYKIESLTAEIGISFFRVDL